MPSNTFTLIASSTVGSGGASSIDFTSIPSTYTDLVLKWSLRNTDATYWASIALNGSTANFSGKMLQGDGGTASSGSLVNGATFAIADPSTATASTFSNGEGYFPNYSGSTNKSISLDMVQETNATTAYSRLSAFLWSNTAAINQITLTAGTSFAQYSTAYLYGVKNA